MSKQKNAPNDEHKAPDAIALEKKLAVLEKQVRHEIDMRIIGYLLDQIKQARAVLDEEEMEIYIEHLGLVLQKSAAQLAPAAEQVFAKVGKDAGTNESMENARILIGAKFKAQDIDDAANRFVRQLLGRSSYGEEPVSTNDLIRQQRSA